MSADDNAFPIPGLQGDPSFNGLTKRELFAAMAMQGLLAHPHTDACLEDVAADAVAQADALLAELEKVQP